MQEPREFEAFVKLLRAEVIRSYLEIGSKWGGSMWGVGKALAPMKMVCVNLPYEKRASKMRPELEECLARLERQEGHTVHCVIGNSHEQGTIENVLKLGPLYDAVFIDAGHRDDAPMLDWLNYGPMARIVAFHDITNTKDAVKPLWQNLKKQYRHEEFVHNGPGIGVLWRHP